MAVIIAYAAGVAAEARRGGAPWWRARSAYGTLRNGAAERTTARPAPLDALSLDKVLRTDMSATNTSHARATRGDPAVAGAGGATGDEAIVVERLAKSYGSTVAVNGLSFAVRAGEIFALLGPNGAGKTTTVEILEGHRHRDGGEVSVLGHDPALRAPELRSRVGIVLQSCGTYPHLTVRETVEHFARLYPAPRGVEETIELAGLQEAADRRARTLSGGQRRRLDLALALVGDP
ncbi:MAG TPA: ABC transporter ATP-binding protein, partial [Ktedonobacterales bacterium]|nr:ABC transporter ATP-binding protein [Ktedonobacterales bacterium]